MKTIKFVKKEFPKLLLTIVFLLASSGIIAQNSGLNQFHKFTGPVSHDTLEFYVSLPLSYKNSTKAYPVIYYLHGMNEYYVSDRGDHVTNFFRKHAAAKKLPEVIIVFPDGKKGAWGNHYDKHTLLETNIIKEIIPYIDRSFRTKTNTLIIMGWSAGGAGAINLFTKHPDLFKGAVSLDGAIISWKEMLAFHPEWTRQITNSDSVYYYHNFSPYIWTVRNRESLVHGNEPRIFLTASFFKTYHKKFLSILKDHNIPHSYHELNCEHNFNCVFSESEEKLILFFADILKTQASEE